MWNKDHFRRCVLEPEVISVMAKTLLAELERTIDANSDTRFYHWRSLILNLANDACRRMADSAETYLEPLLREGDGCDQ